MAHSLHPEPASWCAHRHECPSRRYPHHEKDGGVVQMKNTSESKKRKLWGFLLPAAPYVLWMVAFIVIPLGMVAFFALTDSQDSLLIEKYRTRRRIHERFAAFDQTGGNRDRIVCVDCLSAGLYPFQKTGLSKQTLFIMVMLPMWMNFLLRTFAWMTILEKQRLNQQISGIVRHRPSAHDQYSGCRYPRYGL